MSSAIEPNRTCTKKYGQLNPIERSISELLIFIKKTGVRVAEINNRFLKARVASEYTCVFCNRRHLGEMASDALRVVNVKSVVKGYQECRFDVKEGEEFKVSKKIGEKGCALRVENEPGQFSHLQHEFSGCGPLAC